MRFYRCFAVKTNYSGVKGNYGQLYSRKTRGTDLIEAYAVLVWLFVNASLRYLLRGQLTVQSWPLDRCLHSLIDRGEGVLPHQDPHDRSASQVVTGSGLLVIISYV